MAEIKTKPTSESVEEFLNKVENEQKRKDSFAVMEMMTKATGENPRMWGPSIIGFGEIRYKSPNTGREVDWFIIGFSPRKANLVLYLGIDIQEHAELLLRLGKHKTGVGCLYVNKLADVDQDVLEEMIIAASKK